MKIVIDARFLGTPTGIGRYVEELVRGLESTPTLILPPQAGGGEEGVEFVIFVSKEGWKKWEPRNPKFKKRLVRAHWYTVREQFALWRALREEKPDLAHFPHWNICYFWNGPFVVTIHDLILLEYPTRRASTLGAITYWIKYKILFPLVLRKAIYKSEKILAPSNYTKQSILKHFPNTDLSKIEVIYEGVSGIMNYESGIIDTGKSIPYTLHPIPYLLYVGNALPHKNLEFLLRVLKKLKENTESVMRTSTPTSILPLTEGEEIGGGYLKLILVGENNYFYDRLKKYAKELGIGHDVIFTGKVTDGELAEIYKNAALYVFPSLLEGFGMPALEAMAHGVPVLAARSSCIPEILGEAALYFDPKNEEDAKEKIKTVLLNDSLRKELARKGSEQIKKYSWHENVRQTIGIYRSCA